ncbi:MAG: hydrogenase nickel incorporation protein HypA [Candidatus Brockarchaeota archaeon]|nr:hydrogenase nickel incorporation protein HypA [Candidatus Brockarchaeota archaeon]
MHEWALAESVIKTVLKIAEEKDIEKVTEVKIRIGEMQQLEQEVFKTALLQLRPIKLNETEFIIEIDKTKLRCKNCNYEWFFDREVFGEEVLEAIHFLPEVAHAYVKCPKCGSRDFEIAEGRGVWIDSVKGLRKNG